MVIEIILFALAGGLKAVMDTLQFWHGRSVFKTLPDYSFFGENNYIRKYENELEYPEYDFIKPYKWKWYHNLFDLDYQEKYFGSATFLVFLQDGWHAAQALRTLLETVALILIATTYTGPAIYLLVLPLVRSFSFEITKSLIVK